MFREIFEKTVNHLFEPILDNEYDQWNNPGIVIAILGMNKRDGKTLSTKKTEQIVDGRYDGKVNLQKMAKKGYISEENGEWTSTKFGDDVLSYLSNFSKTKPKGYKDLKNV